MKSPGSQLRSIRKDCGPDVEQPIFMSAEEMRQLALLAAELTGMAKVLGLTMKEKRAIWKEIGVEAEIRCTLRPPPGQLRL